MDATSFLDGTAPEDPSRWAWTRAKTLAEVTSEPDYGNAVMKIVKRIARAEDSAQAVKLLSTASHSLGADVAAFVSFIPDGDPYTSYRFLLACDPGWCFEYQQRFWFASDPWLEYAKNHPEPICASGIAAQNDAERDRFELARRFGFKSTAIIPTPSSHRLGRVGLLCLGSNTPCFFEAEGFVELRSAAWGVAMALNEWWITRLRHDAFRDADLSSNDMQLLRWQWQGLNSKEIGRLLGMQPTSVDTRFQRLNMKLGVPNRQAAAKLAAEYSLI